MTSQVEVPPLTGLIHFFSGKIRVNKAPLGSFLSIYNVVTLKIRSRSLKSNNFFPPY